MHQDDDRVQLKDLCADKGVKAKSTYLGRNVNPSWGSDHDAWKVVLSYKGRKVTVPAFHMGSGHGSKEPEAYEVLGSLLSDVSDFASYAPDMPTFEQWADNFGMDTDSIKALRTYEACKAEYPLVKKFLGKDFEKFAAAEY